MVEESLAVKRTFGQKPWRHQNPSRVQKTAPNEPQSFWKKVLISQVENFRPKLKMDSKSLAAKNNSAKFLATFLRNQQIEKFYQK